uniref:SGNH domain-containing protein n=1 Tax=Panagrolaimus davidi TaxID=227884 RepID=A0A914PGQ5_9BILA
MLCRIWQFIAGILAHSVSVKQPFPEISYGFLGITIGLIFMPFKINNAIISLLAIICASTTIVLSNSEYHPFKKFIPNLNIYQNFIFLGDISYVLYLIHWPIITYAFSLSLKGHIYFYDGIHLVATCVAIAILAHKFIEKPLLNICSDIKKLAIVLGILYLSVFFMPKFFQHMAFDPNHLSKSSLNVIHAAQNLNKPIKLPKKWTSKNEISISEWTIKTQSHFGSFIKCNYKQSIHLPKIPNYLEYCEYNTNSDATLTAIIIGNSFAKNIHYAIVKNPAFRKVISFSASGCQIPYVKNDRIHCKKAAEAMKRLIGEIEPDIVYVIQKYIGFIRSPLEKNWKNDWRFKEWNETFQFIQMHSSAVIVPEDFVEFPFNIAAEFSKRKFLGIDFDGKIKKPVRKKSAYIY